MKSLFVFEPKSPHFYTNKRFLVSAKRLHFYIGVNNANKCILKNSTQKTDKLTLKFRKFGKIDIYLK